MVQFLHEKSKRDNQMRRGAGVEGKRICKHEKDVSTEVIRDSGWGFCIIR